jgi:hypothetical protein
MDHLRSLMRTVYEDPDKARAKALTAAREIRRDYAVDHVVQRLVTRVRATALKLRQFWRSMHRLFAGDHDLISIVAPRA